MINKLRFLILAFFWATCFSFSTSASELNFPYIPNKELTPGDFCTSEDPDYLGDAYAEKIPKCERDVIYNTKQRVYEMYDVKKSCQRFYTIDHFIPLSLGGNNDLDNLWPEAKSIKALRQNLELELFQLLRDGKITQNEAVRRIKQAKLHPPITKPMTFCR